MNKHKKLLMGVAIGGVLVWLHQNGKLPMVKG